MARLPRYQAGGVQAVVPGRVEFAGMREQARFAESIGKMAAFVNREVQEREIRKTREQEEQNALYQRTQVDALKTAFTTESNRILEEAKRSNQLVPMSDFNNDLNNLRDGYLAAAESLDPEYAAFFQNDIIGQSGVLGEQYSTYHQREAIKFQRADALKGIQARTLANEQLANSSAYTPQLALNAAQKVEQYALDNGYSPENAAREGMKQAELMAIQHARFQFDQLGPLEDKEKYIENLRVAGVSIDDTESLKKELTIQVNQERRNFETQARVLVQDYQRNAKNIERGAPINPETRADLDQRYELLEGVIPGIKQERDRFNFIADRLPQLQKMSVSDLNQDMIQQREKLMQLSSDDPDFDNKYAMLSASEELYKNYQISLNSDPYAWFIRTGQLEHVPLVDENAVAERMQQQEYMQGVNPGYIAPFLTTDEVKAEVDYLNSSDPDEVIQRIQGMQRLYGDRYNQAIDELNKGGLANEYAVGARYADNPGLSIRILGLSKVTEKELKDPISTTNANDFNTEFRLLSEEYRSAFVSGDVTGNALKTLTRNFDIAKKLGYSLINETGTTGAEAAAQVFDQMFPERIVNQPQIRLIVPQDEDSGFFSYRLEEALDTDNLRSVDIEPLEDPRFPEFANKEVNIESLSDTGIWLNNSTGDGAVLHYNLDGFLVPVRLTSGEYYEIRFDDPRIVDVVRGEESVTRGVRQIGLGV